MSEPQWELTLVLDENISLNQYPTQDLPEDLEPTIVGPRSFDDWEMSKAPFVAKGVAGQIEAWLSHIDDNDRITSRALSIERSSIPADSYFGNPQQIARQSLMTSNEDTPPLTLLSRVLDDEVVSALVITGCTLACQYLRGKWRFRFESARYPSIANLLQGKVNDELILSYSSVKNEFQFNLDLANWVEPGRTLNEMGCSRYYVDLRKTSRNPNLFGTEVNTSCQRITEHADYQKAILPDPTLIDATLATLVTGNLLLMPAMILWLNRFKKTQLQLIPSDPPTIRKLIDYLLKPNFDSDAAIKLLKVLGFPANTFNFDGERFAISEEWNDDQRLAFQLIVPESRIESLFKLDQSYLDSLSVLA